MNVSKNDWNKLFNLPLQHSEIKITRKFNQNRMSGIKKGFKPQSMDDRWFIYYENDILYIHRSWSGYCIYEIHFIKKGNSYETVKFLVNRDIEQYKYIDDEYDIKQINQFLEMLILNK